MNYAQEPDLCICDITTCTACWDRPVGGMTKPCDNPEEKEKTEMNITVKAIESRNIEVKINPIDALNSILNDVCKVPNTVYINAKGKVETETDISYHGSPEYKYTQYKCTPCQTEIISHINKLKKLLDEIKRRKISCINGNEVQVLQKSMRLVYRHINKRWVA